eukprot:GHVR01122105.1.p1 GENE.GHVR01122105.1~~GHVR01122105.1.p1  ORF type:complete len:216 (+),score=27.62 GHVR01122105.1:30-650(+)
MSGGLTEEVKKHRVPEHEVNPVILNRWSSRAMAGTDISDETLMKLFEAARWAPSAFNEQPWRFIYAKRNTENWGKLLDLLVPQNQQWNKNASVLVLVISKKHYDMNKKLSNTNSLDTGASWENLAIQGLSLGLVVHGMSGFDFDKAKQVCDISDNFKVEMMISIGEKGELSSVPEAMQNYENPSGRKPLSELICDMSKNTPSMMFK